MGKYDLDTTTEEERSLSTAPTARGKYSLDDEPTTYTPPSGTPRTWWDTAKYVGQTADDAMRAAANAISFGMADRLAGAMPGTSTDEQVRLSEEARKRSPVASIGGDIGGAVLLPGIGGRNLAARYGGGLLARGAGYGAEGAVLGAAQGAGNTYTGNPLDYFKNAGTGGFMGGILGAGIGGAFGPRGGMRSSADTPTTAQLFAEKNRNYADLARSPALYEPAALARAAGDAETLLRADRFHQSRSPVTFQALDEMRGAPTAFPLGANTPVSPADIEFIRKGLKQINPVTEATDRASARTVQRALDDFVLNPPRGAVIPGTEAAAREASAIAERARGNYGGYKRGQAWDELRENALDRAGSTYSGLNLQNFLRQGVGGFIKEKEGFSAASKKGFDADEIERLRRFARVPWGDASLRYIDRLMGGGGGLGAVVAGGVGGGAAAGQYFSNDPTWGGIAGVGIPAAGLALRRWGNARALRNVDELGNTIRQRTPLYRERAARAPMVLPPGGRTPAAIRNAITLELLEKQGVPRITVTPREE